MKCARCGNELSSQDRFCGACGAPRSQLPPRFAEVEGRFAVLQDRYRRGELNAAAYEAALRELIFQDDQGQYWMLGADSGAWYFYDGAQWVPGDPLLGAAYMPPPPPTVAARKRFPWIGVILALVVLLVVAAALVVWRFPSLLPFDLGWPPATATPTVVAPTVPPAPTLTAIPTAATSTPTPTRMPIVAPTAGPTPTPTSTPTSTPTPTQTPRPIYRYYFPMCGR